MIKAIGAGSFGTDFEGLLDVNYVPLPGRRTTSLGNMQEYAPGDCTCPIKFQGLRIPSLYLSQGITHLITLVNIFPIEGITGKLLICSAEDLKIEVGLPGPLLTHDFHRLL